MIKKSEDKFKYFKQLYQDNKFDILLRESSSNYWLKLRSISRKELLEEFCTLAKLNSKDIKGGELFEFIYRSAPPEAMVDKFIAQKYKAVRANRKLNETKLVSEVI